MTPLYILLAIFGLWAAYKGVILLYYGIKSGIAQANALEQTFGTDVISAAKYSAGLPFAKNAAPDPTEGGPDAND